MFILLVERLDLGSVDTFGAFGVCVHIYPTMHINVCIYTYTNIFLKIYLSIF